jgi:hypothetical protein
MIAILLAAAAAAPPTSSREVSAHAAMDTRCEACHSASAWTPVTFDHSRTGFPLEGRHLFASCRGCHGSSITFREPVPTNCAACHRDVHTGEFGNRCASCHDARDWTSRFGPDAHRRTNFPLTGRHAAIPCEECHLDQRDRSFTRAAVDCLACHQLDYLRTVGTAVDHARAGFGTDCKSCHFPDRFKGGRFPAHERCFQIANGPHARIACLNCHTSLAAVIATGTCSTNTADCVRCHLCTPTTQQHANPPVIAFQCKDRKCYECHAFSVTGGFAPPRGGKGGPR